MAKPPPQPCAVCGVTFQPYRGGNIYCSAECGRKAYNLARSGAPVSGPAPLTRRCRNKLCIERFVPVNQSHWFHEPACKLVGPDMLWDVEDILREEGSLTPSGSHLEMAKAAFGQKNQALRENTRLRSLRDYLTFELQSFHDANPEYRFPVVKVPPKDSGKKGDREILIQMSDWQVGKWEQGFGVTETMGRVDRLMEATQSIVQRQRDAGYRVTRIVPAFGGDMIEGCLPAGTPVFTEDGPRPIEDIRAGQKVWAYSESGLALRTVTDAAQTGIKPVYSVHTAERDFQLTGNHPVLTRRLVRSTSGKGRRATGYTHDWVAAADLKVGDVVVGMDRLPKADPAPISVEMMEFLGFYLGDGCITRGRKGPNGLSLAHEVDAPYMPHYREIASRLFTHVDGTPLTPRVKGDGCSTNINSRTAAEMIVELGLGGVALTKRVPGWVFTASREQRLAFLRGYLDADGHVAKNGQIIYASAQPELMEDIRHLCMSVGLVVGRIRHQDRLVSPPKGEPRMHRIYIVNCGAADLNAEVGTHTPKYAERWAAVAGRRRERRYTARSRTNGERRALVATPPPGCRYFRVLSVKQGQISQPVFNITVDVDHNYIANGIVHKNCFIYRGQNVTGLDKTSNTHRLTVQIRETAYKMAEFVSFCATLAPQVDVQVVGGNHGRPNGPNDFSDPEDNFDVMAGWWASDLTKDTKHVHWEVHENWWGRFQIAGHEVITTHGDAWTGPFTRLETLLPQWVTSGVFGVKPDVVLTHHRHEERQMEVGGIPVFQNGTLDGGSGWYLRSYGKASRPFQRILTFSDKYVPESQWPVYFSPLPSGALVA